MIDWGYLRRMMFNVPTKIGSFRSILKRTTPFSTAFR